MNAVMNAAINRTSSSMDDDEPLGYHAEPTASASVVHVSNWNDWQVAAVKKILGFRALKQNWDSYGSGVIPHSVICTAISLLSQASLENVPVPTVLPVSGGAIQFEWVKGNRELELEVCPNGVVVLLTIENGQQLEERPLAAGEAVRQLSWLNAG